MKNFFNAEQFINEDKKLIEELFLQIVNTPNEEQLKEPYDPIFRDLSATIDSMQKAINAVEAKKWITQRNIDHSEIFHSVNYKYSNLFKWNYIANTKTENYIFEDYNKAMFSVHYEKIENAGEIWLMAIAA